MATERAWEVLLLGPLVVRRDGRRVDLGGRRQETLLALLALERGKRVSVGRLVDGLWADAPPAGAEKTLQVYVSRLRAVLGPETIRRDGDAYVLLLPDASVDAEKFSALGETVEDNDGRRAALGLWRGEPMADLRGAREVAAAAERLEDLRATMLEDFFADELELGRHAQVLGDLQELTRAHPTRERPPALLMLALYRSGRQADALEVYRETRRFLHDELAIEPGPELQALERAILNQAPELGRTSRLPMLRRGRGGLLALAGGIALIAAAVTFVLTGTGARTAGLTTGVPDSVVEINPETNSVVAEVPIGSAPIAIATGAGAVWVANAGDQTLARVDPVAHEVVARTGLGRIPTQLVFGDGSVWIASAVGSNGVVQQFDPETAGIVSTRTVRIKAGRSEDVFAPATPNALALAGSTLWSNALHSDLVSFDPRRRDGNEMSLGGSESVDGIASGYRDIWVSSGTSDRVLRIDPLRRRVLATIPIAAAPHARIASPYGIATGFGSVWVANALSGTVSEIDPHTNAVHATIEVGARPTDIAVGEGAVWVLNASDGTVTRIDPARHTAVATINVGRGATGIAAGLGGVWVTVAGGRAAGSDRPGPNVVQPLPRSTCASLVHGAGTPDLLLASELPTFIEEVTPDAALAGVRAAILHVLRAHQFRAGRHRIGYQACDDSLPAVGESPERCAATARSLALDRSLVGVIGPFTSACAQVGLPTLNAAPGGPITVISPSNTYAGLTRAGPATAADEPERYYPTGIRNYLRLLGADDAQGAGIALFLRNRHRTRVFVLDDGQGTGYAGAAYVAQAARRLHLSVVGRETWDPNVANYTPLGRRIARARADAVVLSGCICSDGSLLVEQLRATLGNGPLLVGTDNFGSTGNDVLAPGFFVSQAGLDATTLPRAGRKLLPASSLPWRITAAYAATATEVLLQAIAHSDGTRTSVLHAAFSTQLAGGYSGDVRFDENGDPVPEPVSVYRVGDPPSFEQTITPSQALFRPDREP